MHSQRISHNFYLSLIEFLTLAKQHIVSTGGEFGLTSMQAVTLLLLDENRPRPMKNFCLLYHCDASNITGIIDGLEKRGLVSRQNDPNDRRVKVVQLEVAGKALQQTIIKHLSTDNGFLFDPLTATETEQLVHIVEKIAAATAQVVCDG